MSIRPPFPLQRSNSNGLPHLQPYLVSVVSDILFSIHVSKPKGLAGLGNWAKEPWHMFSHVDIKFETHIYMLSNRIWTINTLGPAHSCPALANFETKLKVHC